jgi:hypothetical protein
MPRQQHMHKLHRLPVETHEPSRAPQSECSQTLSGIRAVEARELAASVCLATVIIMEQHSSGTVATTDEQLLPKRLAD